MIQFVDGLNATVNVNVALIKSSENFFINGSNWEGILGLGYTHLSKVLSKFVFINYVKKKLCEFHPKEIKCVGVSDLGPKLK